ncbi:Cobalt-zinc-cadmium resistance protein CzcA [Labilithrix luteola]|uniref:Cobalt-zinc-cadmium resistance protein CzcA n=1 Tax=Labilithrix luteola TaxID=1391654 RepID=A0A0K1Q6U7_9BACT|nr:CusA/CzcA family heavy metal efflux RND transporter [Labilithrix luteola]AKV01556.1 Cobalt-zinc-cadmium resistance protein CzcA [Labilithrix luteola]
MAFLAAIVRWSLANRAVVLVATLLLAALGIRSAFELPIDAVPDLTNVQVQIITAAPALSPVEVEQYVTVPVERAMAALPRTTQLRSISKYGLSVVTVVFRDDTSIYLARQLVSERMREAQEAVPSQYGVPEMGPISTGLGEIYQFSVRGEGYTLMQIEEILDWQIAPQLRSVPGVVEVNSFGGEDKQYQIVLDPARLSASGLSVAQVADAVQKSNANAGGGYIERNREHFVIGTDGLVHSVEDLRRVVIGATPQGVPITVATVGDVKLGPRLRRGAATKDGQGEVAVGVAMMLMGENSRVVTEAVKAKMAAITPSLPKGVRIEPFYDRSELVERTIHTVTKNLLEGALLVVVVLLLLLGDLRAGLVVATVIPLSLLFAITAMNVLGLSGNLMSLGAIDFGLIVDGAVIIVENAVRRLSDRQSANGAIALGASERVAVVEDATLEVRSASVFGEAIIAIVYVPILALTGVEGKLFRPMATTVLLALLGAFLLSLTFVPVLTSYVVKPKPGHEDTWIIRKAREHYAIGLDRAMKHRLVTLLSAGFVVVAAIGVGGLLGAEFVPQLDEGDLLVEARRLPGIALTESIATGERLERALREIPEVETVVSRTGAPEVATDPMGVEQSDIYVVLKDRSQFRKGLTKDALRDEVAAKIEENVPEIGFAVSQPIQMRTNELVAGVRSDVAVLVYGPDLDTLRTIGDEIAAAIHGVRGAANVRVEQVAGLSYLRIVPDRNRLARYGLTIADVNQVTETISVGHKVGTVHEGERRFSIVVKAGHDFGRVDVDALRALPLRSVTGQIVPLGDVADLSFVTGPAQVSRESQSRRLSVELNVSGRDMLSVVHDAQAAVAKQVKLPAGYRVEWGGQFEHYVDAKRRLAIVVPIALALILFLLWLAFQSRRAAVIIFLNVPFAVVGGVFALFARGLPFSISAGVGFIALFGVAVLNGLVLVSFARQLETSPPRLDHVAAVRKAAELRLRPILMTALVASLGFLPMALSTDPGSEVQRPLATVIIGGLVSATLLTLLVLPVVYAMVGAPRRVGRDSLRAPPMPTSD